MNKFVIIMCRNCRNPSLSYENVRAKICPYCGSRTSIIGSRIVGRASSPEEAKAMISALKKKKRK